MTGIKDADLNRTMRHVLELSNDMKKEISELENNYKKRTQLIQPMSLDDRLESVKKINEAFQQIEKDQRENEDKLLERLKKLELDAIEIEERKMGLFKSEEGMATL